MPHKPTQALATFAATLDAGALPDAVRQKLGWLLLDYLRVCSLGARLPWSGWARPPEWIKNVDDRSKFLIAGASAAVDAGSASKAKPVGKKVTAKKTTAVRKAVATTKTALAKNAAGKKAVSAKAPAKKATAKRAAPSAVRKAPAKKVPRNGAAVTAAVTTVESGASSTT